MQLDSALVLIIVGAVVGGFVQGLSGFGFSLVALSFWAWVLDPKLAAVLAVVGGFSGQVLAAFRVRRGFDAHRVLPFIVGGLLGMPLGMWVLPQVDALMFRAFIGTVLAVWCPVMLLSSRLPHIRFGGRVADGLAGMAGGAMGPLGGFTGAAPTLWCTLRGYARDEQRAVVQNFNMTLLGVTLCSYLATGLVQRAMLPLIGVVVVALVVPALVGMRVYVGISPLAFRNTVLGLLTASGLAMLANAVTAWLR